MSKIFFGANSVAPDPNLEGFQFCYQEPSTDNSMVWTNPYEKKKSEPDLGTAVWGDPRKQGEVKKWKVPVGPEDKAASNFNEPLNVDCFSSNWGAPVSSSPSPNVVVPPTREALVQQHVNRIHRYIQIGLLDHDILGYQMPPEALLILNQFFAYAAKLESLQKIYSQLQRSPSLFGAPPSHDMHKISEDIRKLSIVLADLNRRIKFASTAQRNKSMLSSGSNGSLSKLDQWKRGQGTSVMDRNTSTPTPDPIPSAFHTTYDHWSAPSGSSGADWPALTSTLQKENQMESTKDLADPDDDPAIQAAVDEMTRDVSVDEDKLSSRTVSPNENSIPANSSAISERTNLTTPTVLHTFDADVPEFKPGQLWQWRDPKELAQDPEATPGSVNLKKASFSQPRNAAVGSVGHGSGPNANGTDTNGVAADMNGLQLTDNNSRGPNKFAFLPSANRPSSWIRNGPPDTWIPQNEPSFIRGQTLPFAHQAQPAIGSVRAVPYASLNQGIPAATIVPSQSGAFPMQWVVLSNLNLMEESSLHVMLQQVAPLTSFWYLRQAGFAAVKFKDVSMEKVLPRLHMECSPYGIIVQLAKDEDVSLLLQSVNGSHGGSSSTMPTAFGNNGQYQFEQPVQGQHRRGWGATQAYGAMPAYHSSAVRPI